MKHSKNFKEKNAANRVQKPKKHDANLKQNSALYFQVGLVLSLLATYFLFEMRFQNAAYQLAKVDHVDYHVEYSPENFQVEQKVSKIEPSALQKVTLTSEPIIKPDDYKEAVTDILTDVEPDVVPIAVDAIVVADVPDDVDDNQIFNMNGVEQVPIYPGCESSTTNAERKACMSEKLGLLVKNRFNTNMASDLGLSGKQKIYVQFKIDKSGKVTDITSRAPKAALENEVERVLNKVPQMIPGKQRFKPVTVMYVMPIIFDVQ